VETLESSQGMGNVMMMTVSEADNKYKAGPHSLMEGDGRIWKIVKD